MDMRDKILQYYSNVDQSTYVEGGDFKAEKDKIAAIMVLFDDNATYSRTNHPVFRGKGAVENFFLRERSLCGTHNISSSEIKPGIQLADNQEQTALDAENCATVIVRGRFSGKHYSTTAGPERKIT